MSLQQLLDAADVIGELTLHPYELHLSEPWRSSRGTISVRTGFLVRVTSVDGHTGVGDCAPLPEFGTERLAAAESAAIAMAKSLPGRDVAACLGMMDTWPATPALCCAFETALIDLVAGRLGMPMRLLLAPDAQSTIAVNAVVGAADAGLAARAGLAVSKGFDILKIKVGIGAAEDELRRLKELCRRLPAQVRLRLDANGAWDFPTARSVISGLSGMPIECLEEPLTTVDTVAMTNLQELAEFPLALDESLATEAAGSLIRDGAIRRVVLKPTVRGGIMACLGLAEAALDADVKCVVTSTLESPVGLAACAQLAAALPGSLAHGLATGDQFSADDLPWPQPVDGQIRLLQKPGIGIDAVACLESISAGTSRED